MDLGKRKALVELLNTKFLPMDYGCWQPDELYEQIIAVILDSEHVVGNSVCEDR